MEHTFKHLVLYEERHSDGAVITDENGFKVVEANSMAVLLDWDTKLGIGHWADDPRASMELTEEQQAANARRIVACVNACAGLPDALVSHGLVPASRHSTVAQQRDQLLAALEAVCDSFQHVPLGPGALQDLFRARAAIAACKESAT
ncbi:hypothetical protein [Chromobacterium subtsugae]|uniref:hypothetical protein n=1 Tax=Chromobacterium subtsugae TaxID=251747 RepID=UPI0007F8E039|nr:hypothetical protein [Chromobacterium subtsugae]OBU84413.1 hypothetical protein MY55_22300 [Chromobacterium subtsugae]